MGRSRIRCSAGFGILALKKSARHPHVPLGLARASGRDEIPSFITKYVHAHILEHNAELEDSMCMPLRVQEFQLIKQIAPQVRARV
jgi:hypothetical protein